MAKSKDHMSDFEVLNLKYLARETRISYAKIRNCIAGKYSSLSDEEKTIIFNCIYDGVKKSVAFLGFSYEGKKIKPKD